MATTTHRVFNFSAGPAVLPLPVLEEAQRDLIALPGVGMSVLEISHRSKTFEAILAKTEQDLRAHSELAAFYIFPPHAKNSLMNLFSTHPPMEKRIAALSRLESQLQGAA